MADPITPAQPRGGLRTLLRFLPMLWPKGEGELKARVVAAVLLVLGGRAISIAMTYPLKLAVDRMGAHAPAAIVIGLVLAYCAARFGGVLSDNLRYAIFE
jgi:ATP-binding cassette subfamily B protein